MAVPDPIVTFSRLRCARRRSAQAAALTAILLFVSVVYLNVTTAYFCGQDDFLELHRAAFEDSKRPSLVFTTPHFGSFKYRPLNRGLNLLTYRIANGAAQAFRVRNLLFHEVNVLLVYFLGVLLGMPALVAGTAAVIFGLHPLANQSVIGAVMTNTAAHSAYLCSIVLLILPTRRWQALLIGMSALVATVSLLLYDSNIVVLGSLYAYLFVVRAGSKQAPDKQAAVLLTLALLPILAVYAGLKLVFVPSGYASISANMPTPAAMIKSAITYAGALLCPLDPVLAHSLGLPLPSDPTYPSVLPLIGAIVFGVAIAIVMLGVALTSARRSSSESKWTTEWFLACSAVLPLAPVLVFSSHPSETYLYLTVAFAALLLASVAYEVCLHRYGAGGARRYAATAAVLVVCCGAATVVRNARVAKCGDTAHRILSSIPFERFKDGGTLLFTDALDRVPSQPYGLYGFTGMDTIICNRSHTLTQALQFFSGNKRIVAEAPGVDKCGSCAAHFWIHTDGRVREAADAARVPRSMDTRK